MLDPGRTQVLDLSAATLIARGGTRLIFEHPALPGTLIKVFRPELLDENGQRRQSRRRWWKWPRRLGMFLTVQREVREFLALRSRPALAGKPLPVERVFGFVETSLGLGLAVERLSAPDGSLAPTLRSLLKQGRFTPRHRAALHRFLEEIQRLHVGYSDLHAGNLVFVEDGGSEGRFVGVDGMGDRAAIPATDYSRRLNAWQIRRRARKLWAAVAAAEGRSAGAEHRQA